MRRTNIVFLFTNYIMDILTANVTYNLAIIFLVFRELVNVLNNYCFHTENILLDTKKVIFCTEIIEQLSSYQ